MSVFQAFWTHSSIHSEPTYIQTHLDNRTGQRYVLWDDIRERFQHAKALNDGRNRIPFLAGADLSDHIPLRIGYRPGVMLEVVVGTTEETRNVRSITSSDDSGRQSLVVYSANQDLIVGSSMPPYTTTTSSQQSNSNLLAITSGHEEPDNRLKQEMEKNCVLNGQVIELQQQILAQQEEILRLQERIQSKDQLLEVQGQEVLRLKAKTHTNSQLSETQREEAIRLQIQVMNQLSETQMLLARTCDLDRDPVPRLFVILPMPRSGQPDVSVTDPSLFQLYFLCECGAHTMSGSSETPHEVHLAKHEGYLLDNPVKFLEKYGRYTLAMMNMVKYGVRAAGTVVPPLESFSSVIDDTIVFLRGRYPDVKTSDGSSSQPSMIGMQETLESVDLRELKFYIKVNDGESGFGNLYRVATREGDIKWVCLDHYRSLHQDPIQLRTVVESNHGKFTELTGRIEIRIATPTLAKQFYGAMVKSRVVQELDITLQWDATMDELQDLCSAVTKAKVISLSISGFYLKGRQDRANRYRRFDPIIQLAANGRIQSLRLNNFDDFFGHVYSPLSLSMAPRLRVLSVDSVMPFDKVLANSFLSSILDKFSSLCELDLRLEPAFRTRWSIPEIVSRLDHIETLALDFQQFSTRMVVSKGTIQSAEVWVTNLGHLLDNDREFLQQGYIDQLVVESIPVGFDDRQLGDILRQNPRIKSMTVGCNAQKALGVINSVIANREKAVKKDDTPLSQFTFELKEDQLVPWVNDRPFDGYDHITATVVFPANSFKFSMRTRFIMCTSSMFFGMTNVAADIISNFGSSLETLRAPSSFADHHAQYLDIITRDKGSQLAVFEVDTSNLREQGLESLSSVLERSELLNTPKMWAWAFQHGIAVEGWGLRL
ncbi:hypothetical protein B0O80DRAFT_500992 [Mortierella sp. GBAus27b]|nr:hypothetical protein BGX31_010260 [Mortierella sp. GBA43]KAI8350057.1 hypothetical protein B0O80DRAFT_500992 [Mortierella sp. GBAus27b]